MIEVPVQYLTYVHDLISLYHEKLCEVLSKELRKHSVTLLQTLSSRSLACQKAEFVQCVICCRVGA